MSKLQQYPGLKKTPAHGERMPFASICPRCNQLPIQPNTWQHLRALCPRCLAQFYSCLPSLDCFKAGELPHSDGSSQHYASLQT